MSATVFYFLALVAFIAYLVIGAFVLEEILPRFCPKALDWLDKMIDKL